MDDTIRRINLSPSIPLEETTTPQDLPATTQSGIGSTQDSIELAKADSVFTADPLAGEVSFGDGVLGSKLPEGGAEIQNTYATGVGGTGNSELSQQEYNSLMDQSKTAIFNYLNGSIDNMLQVAQQRSDAIVQQTNMALKFGVVIGDFSISTAFSELRSYAEITKSELSQQVSSNTDQLEERYQQLKALADEQQATREASQPHLNSVRDAILDFLKRLMESRPKFSED
jgi:hypothetical protein